MKKLSSNEILLINNCLQKQNIIFSNDEDINCLNSEQYNYLRDIVCDELIANGFSKNGDINEYGKSLEDLIDSLGRFFM